MARQALGTLDGKQFDVAVVGAGLNGISSAQHLAAAGYSVLLVEKNDFCTGASSRSSRMLSCGIRYLDRGMSMWQFMAKPDLLFASLKMARQAMKTRSQFVNATSEHLRELKFAFPIYKTDYYQPWQVKLAFKTLEILGPGDVPIDFKILKPAEIKSQPLLSWMRDQDQMKGAAMFREYHFDWPERVAMDTVLDAERMGAVVRNYTAVTGLRRDGEGWRVSLADSLQPGAEATVKAKVVLNMAGTWIDRVNKLAGDSAKRKICGTKGVHFAVKLPPECQYRGVMGHHREGEHLYCFPWRDLHYFGPTETLFEGNIDDIRATDNEIDWLMAEANHLFPSLNLKRSDILFSWAGVRPLTYDPRYPKGSRDRLVHDLASEGMPGVLAMTAGPIMTHRSAGQEMCAAVAAKIKPSGSAQQIDYSARKFPENQNSPPLLDHWTTAKVSDLKHVAATEYPATLVDAIRRVGAHWTRTMAGEAAEKAARAIAPEMGWDEARIMKEAKDYVAYIAHQHLRGPDGLIHSDAKQ
ncbi:MAG: FAD-dependent oxidoreductase [Alphaproteobacteria bacterium]